MAKSAVTKRPSSKHRCPKCWNTFHSQWSLCRHVRNVQSCNEVLPYVLALSPRVELAPVQPAFGYLSKGMDARGCLVYGSINIDEIFRVPRIAKPGDTIHSTRYSRRVGGKGCNQGIALSKAGGRDHITFGGAIGKDAEQEVIKDLFPSHGIESRVRIVNGTPTGRAIIQVSEDDGDNCIVLIKGANELVESKPDLRGFSHLLLQNEICPLADLSEHIAKHKTEHDLVVILNPAPMPSAAEIRQMDWTIVDWLVVNQTEAADLAQAIGVPFGIKTLKQGLPNSIKGIIVTLGSKGVKALLSGGDEIIEVPASKVETVVDTTGAGDCFVGYLVAGLMRTPSPSNKDMKEILITANQAAGISVSRSGGITSYPDLQELKPKPAAV